MITVDLFSSNITGPAIAKPGVKKNSSRQHSVDLLLLLRFYPVFRALVQDLVMIRLRKLPLDQAEESLRRLLPDNLQLAHDG
jgi:hypothetical protein